METRISSTKKGATGPKGSHSRGLMIRHPTMGSALMGPGPWQVARVSEVKQMLFFIKCFIL